MANLASKTVTETVSELTSGLTAGQTYRCQNTGSVVIQYCTATTKAVANNRSWFIWMPGDDIIVEPTSTDKTWVRTIGGGSSVAVGQL